ncbi:MAG TPA: hypothetical protein VF541_02060 [Longimicrobium sp.]|jgi:hypothetical protein
MYLLETYVEDAGTNGVHPQVADMGDDYRWDDPDSVTRMRSGRPLAVTPNLSFHLDPETNATDVVTQGYTHATGLLVSEAFCAALEGRAVQAHERYAAQVVDDGEVLSYRWLHVVEQLEGRIDYRRSEFTVRNGDGPGREVTFADADDLRRQCRELVNSFKGALEARRVSFLPGTPRYDFFTLLLTSQLFFVSDSLAAEMTRRKLTGFHLVPAETVFGFE